MHCAANSILILLVTTTFGWQAAAAKERSPDRVAIYDKEPSHLWNRVHTALLVRLGPDGKPYGLDRLEPLLWGDSEHLLTGKTADEAATVLEEFVRNRGETLVQDPLKRALLQRDLWLVANWAAESSSDGADKLLAQLVPVIRRVALPREEIGKLPDNYALAVAARHFSTVIDPEKPQQAFLPRELFQEQGPWVCIGRPQGPTAPMHLQNGNVFNNSAFFIFLKLPGGRAATLAFIEELAAFDKPLYIDNPDPPTQRSYQNLPNPALPQWPKGTEVALVRRALLIDNKGEVVASPLTESVQIRVMRVDTPPLTAEVLRKLESGLPGDVVNGLSEPEKLNRAVDAQAFAEFQLSRRDLLAGRHGGLNDVSLVRDFKTGFNAHAWDEFDSVRAGSNDRPFPERVQPFINQRASCIGCHRYPGVYSFNSFHSMFPFSLQRRLSKTEDVEGYFPKSNPLVVKTVSEGERAAVEFKAKQDSWQALRAAWK